MHPELPHTSPQAETAIWRCWYVVQRVVALLALVLALPILAVLFVAVRLDSRGGFLYRQERPGRGGRLF